MLNNLEGKFLFIILHGYGSNGEHLEDVALFVQKTFPNSTVLTPNAPFKSLNNPDGYEWFPITQVREDYFLEGLRTIFPYIKNYIDLQVKETNIPYENVILSGFSQGACIAIHSALRLDKKIKAIISFSGGLVDYQNSLEKEIKQQVPTCLIHGRKDRIIPYLFSDRAKNTLNKNNVPNELNVIENLDHYINHESLDCMRKFLQKLENN